MDTTKTITHISLCAGYGGIDLGLKRVMKLYDRFKQWYAREGVRTMVAQAEGYNAHEEYQKVAYAAGWTAAMAHACDIVDKLDKELKKKD